MTEPETRSLLGWEHENPDVYNQEAIPWCTTHDNIECDGAEYPTCWARIHGETEGDVCVISHGGPDHKWWKDT